MSRNVGVWIDYSRAVIASSSAGQVTTRTLKSDVEGIRIMGASRMVEARRSTRSATARTSTGTTTV